MDSSVCKLFRSNTATKYKGLLIGRSSVQFSEIVPALFGMTDVLRFFLENLAWNFTKLYQIV